MAAYRADIEIGVRGARSLEQLRSSINQTATAVDSLNSVVSARGSLVQNIQNYTNNLNRAAESLTRAAAGTEAETKAVREYVQALGQANSARARQNSLVAQEIANQRRVSPSTAPYGQQGPALPPAMIKGRQIQQSWNNFFQEAAQVGQELQTSAAAKTLNIKNNWNTFFQEAAQVGQELQTSAAAKTLNIKTSWNNFFQEALDVANELTVQAQRTSAAIRNREGAASAAARQRLSDAALQRQRIANAGFGVQGPALPPQSARKAGAGFKGRIGEALGGGIIGAGFPLLFGQTGGAAVGGAIGGVAGALAGPGGSFAGSILGTVIGEIASKGQAVKTLGEDLGFSAQQADALAAAFKTANTDVEKFTAVVQNIRGVGLDLEDQADAVQLVTALTEKYGGTWEKIGNAITSSLESGKVTQATLNQLTSQGVTIQDALAAKYNVSRDAILQMAKEGDISVQTLLDTLVELGNASTTAAQKVESPFQKAIGTTVKLFQGFWQEVQTIFAGVQGSGTQAATKLINVFNTLLQEVLLPLGRVLARIAALFVNVVSTGVSAAADLITGFRGVASAIGDAVMNVINMIPGLKTIVGLARQLLNRVAGPKSSDWNDMPWPEGVPKPGSPGMVGNITAPAQFIPTDGAGTKGPKPPKDRTALLLEDLQAMKLMSATQDGIRDALFEGNKELAIRLEYDQKVADINRDTAKAILNANYETEKIVIRAQEVVRLKDAELERLDKLRELEREITQEYYTRAGLNTRNLTQREGAGAFDLSLDLDPNDKITQKYDEMKQRLEELADPIYAAAQGAQNIGSEFSAAFQNIVSGAQSTQEALSNFFKGVGDAFVSMAADIIAQMVVMFAFKQLLGILGASSGGLFSGGGPVSGASVFGAGQAGFNPLAFTPGVAFAEGGFVTGPTSALIGEGGEPEYVIPFSKMDNAMANHSAGARGEDVFGPLRTTSIPFTKTTERLMTERSERETVAAINNPKPLDVRYQSQVINGVEYVTAEQHQRGMTEAAERGRSLALSALQNSVKTRKRVGMS